MYKGKDLLGKKIVSHANGETIAEVKDLVFDTVIGKVQAFLTEEGGLISTAKVLPAANVHTIGKDAVIVKTEEMIVSANQVDGMNTKVDGDAVAIGTKLMTEDGREVGTISDIYFAEKTFNIVGFEISGGVFTDLYEGKSFLPAPKSLRIGEDYAFVPNETAEFLDRQVGGLKAKAQDLSDKTSAKYQEFKEVTKEKYDELSTDAKKKYDEAKVQAELLKKDAGDKYDEYKSMSEDKYNELSGDAQVKYNEWRTKAETKAYEVSQDAKLQTAKVTIDEAKGKFARNDVYQTGGSLLIARGQMVTDEIIQQAKDHEKQDQLVSAVNLSATSAMGSKASKSASEFASQSKDVAGSWWNKIKQTGKELAGKAGDKVEEERIKRALGRPASRVVLDHNDNPILNTGEIITRESVQKARSANVLDLLLSSADTSNPDFSKEDRTLNNK